MNQIVVSAQVGNGQVKPHLFREYSFSVDPALHIIASAVRYIITFDRYIDKPKLGCPPLKSFVDPKSHCSTVPCQCMGSQPTLMLGHCWFIIPWNQHQSNMCLPA